MLRLRDVTVSRVNQNAWNLTLKDEIKISRKDTATMFHFLNCMKFSGLLIYDEKYHFLNCMKISGLLIHNEKYCYNVPELYENQRLLDS